YASSGRRFVPWGLSAPEVIPETVWASDFGYLVDTFREVRRLGANTVRFGLQFAAFVGPPSAGYPDGTPNAANLALLQNTVDMAEQMGMYIELSGLRVETDAD